MRFLFFLLLLIPGVLCLAQESEFAVHRNGLIYGDTTMRQLHRIVDSLNLKFKSCDVSKRYYGVSQARGHYIRLDTGDIAAAVSDLQRNIPFGEFRQRHPAATVRMNCLVTRSLQTHRWGDRTGEHYVNMSTFGYAGYDGSDIAVYDTTSIGRSLAEAYAFERSPKSDYSKERVEAIYFPDGFQSPELAPDYVSMIQYVDCMVDTGQSIFYDEARQGSWWSPETDAAEYRGPAFRALDSFLDKATFRKSTKTRKHPSGWYYRLESDSIVEKEFQKIALGNPFQSLLVAASEEAMRSRHANFELEYLSRKYGDPRVSLHLMRCREVVGGCSQDASPRYHALGIALLAARTVNWEIFLRSHLDIMNDNFQRVSDGNYAWARRQTYVRELEELEFDVEKLLLGISLRVSNASPNHYYGSIGRLGRALSEYRWKDSLESKITTMISDPKLDHYNRVLMYYLYVNYQYNRDKASLKDDVARDNYRFQPDQKLLAARNTLPDYIRESIIKSDKE